MENNLKWADVAHYYKYVKHEVIVSHNLNPRPLRRISEAGEDLGIYYHRPDLVSGGFTTVPFLRHRDDMTEEEIMEFFGLPVISEGFVQEFRLRYTWKPSDLVKMIGMGFDMFGLIESGQAIRKEAANG